MAIRSIREVKQNLSRYIRSLSREVVVVTNRGKPCAGLLRLEDDGDVETFLVANNKKLMELYDRSLRGDRHSMQEVEEIVRRDERKEKRRKKAA